MSFGLQLADEARRAFAELQPDVQEEVLDILERIAEEAEEDNAVTATVEGMQVLLYRSGRDAALVYLYYSVMRDSRFVVLDQLVAVVTGS